MGWLGAQFRRVLDAERDRWFLWWPVCFGAGNALYFALGQEPSLLVLAVCAMGAVALQINARSRGLWVVPAAMVAAITGGALLAKVRTEFVRAPVLERNDTSVTVSGWLELVEPRPTRGQRLTLRVAEMLDLPPEQWPRRIRVRTRDADATLRPGAPVTFRATLTPPASPALPGGYDFGRAAWYLRLGAVGFVPGTIRPWVSDRVPPLDVRIFTSIEQVRLGITQRIMAAVPGETGAIAAALITGERGAISEETNAAYRASGLFHVLSISGLHMVIMAGALFWLVRFLLAAVPAIALRYPIKKLAAGIALAGALAYLLISGAAVATVRSYVMISIMFIAVILDRPAVALRNIALAAAVILILTPESILDAGFQMSFAAVTGLVAANEALRRRREWLSRSGTAPTPYAAPVRAVAEIVVSTLIASIVVAPFGIYHFHNTQTLALIANVLAIPICNVLVMPAALAALLAMPFGFEAVPLWMMGMGIEAMGRVATAVAALPGAIWRIPEIPTLSFGLMIGGGLWLILWSQGWRTAGFVPLLAGLMLAPTAPRLDLIVGRDGTALAFRAADGRLGIVSPQGAAFETGRWLEHDGDARPAMEAARATKIDCDSRGCLGLVAGRRFALMTHPSAMAEDCKVARIVVASFPVPASCARAADDMARSDGASWPAGSSGREPMDGPRSDGAGSDRPGSDRHGSDVASQPAHLPPASAGTPKLIIDATAIRQRGVHTVRIMPDHYIVEAVDDRRQGRPWGALQQLSADDISGQSRERRSTRR